MPHSHTDPGWIETLEHYYNTQVRDILNNVVAELTIDDRKRFVWAETCYLKAYMDENPDKRDAVVRLVESGRLELVGGGWV